MIGIAVCVSAWVFLREHKVRELQSQSHSTFPNNGITTDNRTAPQMSQNFNDDSTEVSLTKEQRIARRTKSLISIFDDVLTTSEQEKMRETMDSPEYFEMLKNPSTQKVLDFWESKGFSVPRGVGRQFFSRKYPGKPEDYELEMRAEVAKLFLASDPVDLTDPRAAATQRIEVYNTLNKDDFMSTWYAAQFEEDWDGIFLWRREDMKNNPALVWMTDVQRNAATGEATPKGDVSAPSWDLSSVMESPSISPDTTAGGSPSIFSQSTDALEPPANPKPENDAAVTRAPGLTDVPKAPTALPTGASLEASLKEQFSSERFDRAMSTLEQYGTEEGLRRLRENDPEVAKQIERHRNKEEVSK